MADSRFFNRQGPFSLSLLAEKCGAVLGQGADGASHVADVAPLDKAGATDLSFVDNPKYLADFSATRAAACFVAEKHVARAPKGIALLVSKAPYRAYAIAAQLFYPARVARAGIHASASVDPTARLAQGVEVAPGAVICAGAEIGEMTRIGANAVIGENVRIGSHCQIGPLVAISHSEVGNRVTLHPGVKIGQDGFGFAPDPAGHIKVPQLGRVLVHDDCEIGANTTIDRGAGPDTVIGAGCWIDNLVQIGHNVQMGRGCIVIAQSGIAGSTRLGDFVAVGAQGGLTGHLVVGTGARIAAQSGVMRDVAPGETVGGSPAMPQRQWLRQVAALRKMSSAKEGDQT